MKLREIFYVLGYKLFGYTPKPRKYSYEIHEQMLDGEKIQYAQWLHPKSYRCKVFDCEIQHLQRFLTKGDVAIDIGAHSGDSTLPMAFVTGASGCVLAFESNAYVFDTLQKNSELNREWTNIVPYNLAITEENRVYEFSSNDPGFNNGGNTEKTRSFRRLDIFRQQVQGVNLDDFLQRYHEDLIPRIKYIKVDTEGYDVFIILSIAGLIDRIKPYVQVEMLMDMPIENKQKMFQFFSSRGYSIQDANSTKIIESLDEILSFPTWDMHCTPPGKQPLSDAEQLVTGKPIKNRNAA